MCLPTYGSVFNLMGLCEYLETMVTGAIEVERKSREVAYRKGGPQTPGGWKKCLCDTSVYFELAGVFIMSLCTASPRERKCHPLPYALTSSWSPEEERRCIQCIRIHIITTTSYLCVTCHFSVHFHAHYFPHWILPQGR